MSDTSGSRGARLLAAEVRTAPVRALLPLALVEVGLRVAVSLVLPAILVVIVSSWDVAGSAVPTAFGAVVMVLTVADIAVRIALVVVAVLVVQRRRDRVRLGAIIVIAAVVVDLLDGGVVRALRGVIDASDLSIPGPVDAVAWAVLGLLLPIAVVVGAVIAGRAERDTPTHDAHGLEDEGRGTGPWDDGTDGSPWPRPVDDQSEPDPRGDAR